MVALEMIFEKINPDNRQERFQKSQLNVRCGLLVLVLNRLCWVGGGV